MTDSDFASSILFAEEPVALCSATDAGVGRIS